MSGLLARLRAARPERGEWIIGAVVWGVAMALCICASLMLNQRLPEAHLPRLLLVYFIGGMLAWLVSLPLIRFCAVGRTTETRFAASFLFLTIGTTAATALIFALQYRLFYAQWHAPFGTRIWAFQFVFTSASAVYQFAVLGLRLYLPLGLLFLTGASVLLTHRSR
ncbi:hypothetical protein [Agrobacterium sp. a22-2]|uniref:hypothetical protein n=1 Tax=Agrobacterium sp. a22-2 TaxID=2283840 RepID=UPI0034CE6230